MMKTGEIGKILAGVSMAFGMAACVGGSQAVQRYAETKCRVSPDDSVIAAAVKGYVGQIQPKLVRFAYIPATDSTPPDPAIDVLKAIGPTYMYSTIPAQQVVVHTQLETVGDYSTLLLAYHGLVRKDPLHPVVTLSGHMISGEDSGTVLPKRDLALKCDSTGWLVPAAPKDTTTQHGPITKHARLVRP